jgi:hypothetical protein
MGVVIFEAGKPDQLDELLRPLFAFAIIESLTFQAEDHILKNCSPRHQAGILKNHSTVCSRSGYRLIVDHQLSAGRLEQPVGKIDEGSLAATARTDNRNKFTLVDLKVDVIKGEQPTSGTRLVVLHP